MDNKEIEKLKVKIREYLDEDYTQYLYELSLNSNNLEDLFGLLKRANNLYSSYIDDCNSLIKDINNIKEKYPKTYNLYYEK